MRINVMAQITADMQRTARKQMPFVLSLAINRVAPGARDHVRQKLPAKFTLRNQYTVRGIMVRPGNKADPTAVIRAPGYMAIQETGGERTPGAGRKYLSAPAGDLLNSRSVIPKRMRPRALLSDRAFIIDTKNGPGVFLRYGKKRGSIRLLWWLSEEHRYEDRFEFEADVQDYVQDRFPEAFRLAMLEAFSNGGYADSPAAGRRGRKRNARPEGMSARAFRRAQSRGGA